MDTGEGKMVSFNSEVEIPMLHKKCPKAKGVFYIGEELEIKGSKFKVKDITPFGIRLKLLKQ